MKVDYLKQFSKDLSKINDDNLNDRMFEVILDFKKANNLNEIPSIKKLKGHPNAFRFRIGKYRLGFYFDGEVIELARFTKREDIYKLFP